MGSLILGSRSLHTCLDEILTWITIFLSEVTIAFNPVTYIVEEGQDVIFMIQLIGQAVIDVQVNFQTADSTAIGKLRHKLHTLP